LPPSIAITIAQLNDRQLSAHITVDSRTQLSARVLGHAETNIVTFDGMISAGNEIGTLLSGGQKHEFRLVDGVIYDRLLPSGRWTQLATIRPYLIVPPIFDVTSPKMLQLIGQETRDGQPVNHFRSTQWWVPDISRVALVNLASLYLKPDSTVLDLWATPDGAPVAATFSGTNIASDGTKLVDIEVAYSFTHVGVPVDIRPPEPSPSPQSS
jgi:hypothetical protein